jgi:hypothetical protein
MYAIIKPHHLLSLSHLLFTASYLKAKFHCQEMFLFVEDIIAIAKKIIKFDFVFTLIAFLLPKKLTNKRDKK